MVAVKATKEDLNSWLDDDDDDSSDAKEEKPKKTEEKKSPSKKTYALWRMITVVCLRRTTFLPNSESKCVIHVIYGNVIVRTYGCGLTGIVTRSANRLQTLCLTCHRWNRHRCVTIPIKSTLAITIQT